MIMLMIMIITIMIIIFSGGNILSINIIPTPYDGLAGEALPPTLFPEAPRRVPVVVKLFPGSIDTNALAAPGRPTAGARPADGRLAYAKRYFSNMHLGGWPADGRFV